MSKNTIPIGGQALLEGVMFKSNNLVSYAVRDPKGKIQIKTKKFSSVTKKNKILALPVIRGVVNLVEMLKVGFEALNYSAKISGDEEFSSKDSFFATFFAIIFAIGIFVFLPMFLTKILISDKGVLFNILDGIFRIIVFIIYVLLISLIPDIKRVFQYHGAEHATINCYEKLKDSKKVTARKAINFSTLHPRCGTSFIFILLIVSVIFFSLFDISNIFLRILSRIIFLPVIAGISYELLKFSSKYERNPIIKILISPGLLIQKITTKKPDIKQVEVAIASFKKHF